MNRITRNALKLVQSLRHKKYRDKERCFLVEGEKSVYELLCTPLDVVMVVCTASFLPNYEKWMIKREGLEVCMATAEEMRRFGSLQSNNTIIAVAGQRPNCVSEPRCGEWLLALDDIRDPGNLGAILRTADWFGVRRVVASEQTVDYYNPKVIHATMGSFARVQVGYTLLESYLATVALPVYGMFLGGEPLDEAPFSEKGGVIVVGNESKGISASVTARVDYKVGIPRLGGAESLNAAMASGIALYEATRSKRQTEPKR